MNTLTIDEVIYADSRLANKNLLFLVNLVSSSYDQPATPQHNLPGSATITTGYAVALWTAAEILERAIIEPEQLWFWLQSAGQHLVRIGDDLGQLFKSSDEPPLRHMAIADRQYISLTGVDEMVDIKRGRVTGIERQQILEGITYSITAIAWKAFTKLQQMRERRDASSQSTVQAGPE